MHEIRDMEEMAAKKNAINTMGMDSESVKLTREEASDVVRWQRIFFDVEREIKAQDKKWGKNRRKPIPNWFVIIDEEKGEVARSILDNDPCYTPDAHTYEEAVQMTALCMQLLNDIRLTLAEKRIRV